jgi:hypothetical protein
MTEGVPGCAVRALTDGELLAFAVWGERCYRAGKRGVKILLPPAPRCPHCRTRPEEVLVRWDGPLMIHGALWLDPCGHVFSFTAVQSGEVAARAVGLVDELERLPVDEVQGFVDHVLRDVDGQEQPARAAAGTVPDVRALADQVRRGLRADDVTARLAARDAGDAVWVSSLDSGHAWRFEHTGVWGENGGIASGAPAVAHTGCGQVQRHIARHDPRRVAFQAAALLRLVDEVAGERHGPVVVGGLALPCDAVTGEGRCDCGRDARISRWLGLLASFLPGEDQDWPEEPHADAAAMVGGGDGRTGGYREGR